MEQPRDEAGEGAGAQAGADTRGEMGFMAPIVAATPNVGALEAAGLLVADSAICAMAAARFGRIAALLARTAPGSTARLAAAAEAANLLDADDTLLNGSHFGGLVTAVGLAEAARTGADWGTLLRAVAVGFECNARLNLATRAQGAFLAPGIMLPGAVAAVALLRETEGLAALPRALAIAHRFMPAPMPREEALGQPSTLKYGPYSQLAATAPLVMDLAMAGWSGADRHDFLSPTTLGLHRLALDRPDILAAPANDWWIAQTSFKPYPTFRIGQPVLDAFRAAIADGPPPLDAVQEIRLWLDPRALRLPFHTWPLPDQANDLLAVSVSMNLRLAVALLAAGHAPGPGWCAGAWRGDPAVPRWFAKVAIDPVPAVTDEDLAARADPRSGRCRNSYGRVRIAFADRPTREAQRDRVDGDPWFADTRADWPWMEAKAIAFLGSPAPVRALAEAAPGTPVAALLERIGWPFL